MTTVTGSPGVIPAADEPRPGRPVAELPSEPAPVPARDTTAASVESEVGGLVVRVAQLTQELLEEARHQAEKIVADARAEAALIVTEAHRRADGVRADARERDPAVRQIQSAIETLERVRYELSRGGSGAPVAASADDPVPSSAPAPSEG
ncbi:MAG TPA: hypothetical protein VKR22_00880 [Acidimicrobiales bacterium]|nr:hypothetical protein [Acidimicrobiales bacterium]